MEKLKIKHQDEVYQKFLKDLSEFPFSFEYNGEKIQCFSKKDFTLLNNVTTCEEDCETSIFEFDFRNALKIKLKLVHYYDFNVTEWTIWFENNSGRESGIISSLKTELKFNGKDPVLKGIMGDHVNRYRPYSIDLKGKNICYSSDSGRATHVNFPYFNLEYGNRGAMLAIGWAGTWCANFSSDGRSTIYTASSVNGINTYLKPNEKIRTALFLVGNYQFRNEDYATNYWRRFYIRHVLPKSNSNGEDLLPFSTCCLASDTGYPNSDGSISERYTTWKPSLEKMLEENIKVDFRWVDAGWYIAPDGTSPQTDWWGTVGTWCLDQYKWPDKTFLESTEFARNHGMKTLLWFEPEHVTDPDNLEKFYGYKKQWAIQREGISLISNNIGDEECFNWTTDRICRTLRENKVEMYREDNNGDAAELWKYLDETEGENRRGITESKFINAHYAMWDKIIECTSEYGGCSFVDSCASGGGRNDLESMRRGIPMLRSDNDRTSVALRLSMTTSFNKWIPFCGANTKEKLQQLDPTGVSDVYVWRASYLPALNVDSQFVQAEDQNFDILRFGLREWKKVSPYLLKDFYTLTPWHSEEDKTDFTAYSYFDEEKKKGVLFVFRQEECARDTILLKFPFLKRGEKCILTNEDNALSQIYSYNVLKKGIEFKVPKVRRALLYWLTVEKENSNI